MKLSTKAWKISSDTVCLIMSHSFNQELIRGDFEYKRLLYYIQQECVYLKSFSKCNSMIASKISKKYIDNFLRYSDYLIAAEKRINYSLSKDIKNFPENEILMPATLHYTSYLMSVVAVEPVEVAVAAVLPYFWISREVCCELSNYPLQGSPYNSLMQEYIAVSFEIVLEELIEIFDDLAERASENIRSEMLNAFYRSVCFKWHFVNDAYNKAVFHPINKGVLEHNSFCDKNAVLYS